MTHLSADELKTWYEQGSGDRVRVIGHLAECESCRKALSALAMAAESAEDVVPAISVDEARSRGYDALSPGRPRPMAWLRPVYGLAAAAAIVLAVVWVTSPSRRVDDTAVRSSDLVGLSPVDASDASVFTFASPFDAARYRLTVRDANGAVVMSTEGSDGRIAVDRSLRDRLAPGQSYSWVITALDASGAAIADSKPRSFRFEP